MSPDPWYDFQQKMDEPLRRARPAPQKRSDLIRGVIIGGLLAAIAILLFRFVRLL